MPYCMSDRYDCTCEECVVSRSAGKSCSGCGLLYPDEYMSNMGPSSNYSRLCSNCYIASRGYLHIRFGTPMPQPIPTNVIGVRPPSVF